MCNLITYVLFEEARVQVRLGLAPADPDGAAGGDVAQRAHVRRAEDAAISDGGLEADALEADVARQCGEQRAALVVGAHLVRREGEGRRRS